MSTLRTPSPELVDACGAAPGLVCEWVYDATDNRVLAKLAQWSVDVPVRILVIVAVSWLVLLVVRWAIGRSVNRLARLIDRSPFGEGGPSERAVQRTHTLGSVLRSAATGVVWAVAVIAVLAATGLDITALAFGTAALGAGLGFGAQSMVRDLLSGMFLLVEDQCSVGDQVQVGAVSGTVEKLSLRTTRIRDARGTVWHVSNGEIRMLGNSTQEWAVALLDVQVDIDADIDLASSVILDVAQSLRADSAWALSVVADPVVLGVEDVADDRVTIRLSVRTSPGEQWRVARELRLRLKRALADAAIAVPRSPVAPPVVPADPE